MHHTAISTLYLTGMITLAISSPLAHAQEKIEGKVVTEKTTHCDMNVKIGGCAGTLTLQRGSNGKKEELIVNVPLGTHITRGSATMYLTDLRGKNVIITQVTEKNERVARAIEVK